VRKTIKTISNDLVKFIPKTHAEDKSLSEGAKDIKDRPLVFMVKKMNREQRYNLSSTLDVHKSSKDEIKVGNLGSAYLLIWESCVVEVRNVLTDEGEFEKMVGEQKNNLFNTTGIENEILECIAHIQSISTLDEAEAKN
jgi:hypothetical protein